MDNVTQLLIRACKVKEPIKRLESVYRRFYFGGECKQEEVEMALGSILSNVVDKYCPMTINEYLREFDNHENYYRWCEQTPRKYQLILQVLRSKITFTEIDKFEGLTKPARWRNRE